MLKVFERILYKQVNDSMTLHKVFDKIFQQNHDFPSKREEILKDTSW